MAKIIIRYGAHPNEALAPWHAKKVAKILREFGNEVILSKVPVAETFFAKRKALSGKDATFDEMFSGELKHFEKLALEHHKTNVFDFHNSFIGALSPHAIETIFKVPVEGVIEHDIKDYRQKNAAFHAKYENVGGLKNTSYNNPFFHVIEIAAAYKQNPLSALDRLGISYGDISQKNPWNEYFRYVVDMKESEKLGLKDESLSKKIADYIHDFVNGKKKA